MNEKRSIQWGLLLWVLCLLIAICLGIIIGGILRAQDGLTNELERWNEAYLEPYLELYEDYVEYKLNDNTYELSEDFTSYLEDYFEVFIKEVEAKLVTAEQYRDIVGYQYAEYYREILHWCYFVCQYFI